MDSPAVRHRPAVARLITRRTRGPLFLTDRKAPTGTPTPEVCPETGRARLSYRRAEGLFEENTRLPANLLASPDDIEDLDGWTLHRLRPSALTHDAEYCTSTPMLPVRSRHASVRFLERYARPDADSVARHVAEHDPAARRRISVASLVESLLFESPIRTWQKCSSGASALPGQGTGGTEGTENPCSSHYAWACMRTREYRGPLP